MPIQNSKIMEALSDKEELELVAGGCSYNTMRVFNVSLILKMYVFFCLFGFNFKFKKF